MASEQTEVDVVVLGGGFAAGTIAVLLARHGVAVALVRGGPAATLPGEAVSSETAVLLRILAARFDVPELAHLATAAGVRAHVGDRSGESHGIAFVHHCADQPAGAVTRFPSTDVLPHLMRAEVDDHLARTAAGHGARLVDGSPLETLINTGGVQVRLSGGTVLHGAFIVDTIGRDSPFVARLEVAECPPRYATACRTLTAQMRGVLPYDGNERRHHDTLHHVFDGGWVGVSPFDNHDGATCDLTSVTLGVDLNSPHAVDGRDPARQWQDVLDRFPAVARQFAQAEVAAPWRVLPRTQFSCSAMTGHRWALLGPAAGEVDALFGWDLSTALAAIAAFVPVLLAARDDGDFRASRFRAVERLQRTRLAEHDQLVAGAYLAARDAAVWQAWTAVLRLQWTTAQAWLTKAYQRFLDTGDVVALDGEHVRSGPAVEVFENCFAVVKAFGQGAMPARTAVNRIEALLAGPAPLVLHV